MTRRLHRAVVAVAAVALALVASACTGHDETIYDPSPPPSERDRRPTPTEAPTSDGDHLVSGDGWRGALLDADIGGLELPDGTWLDDVDSFRPTEGDAHRFEAALPGALAGATSPSGEELTAADVEDHMRQYTGVEGGGERHLVVAALCRPEDFPGWETQWIEVSDGGDCFWDAAMDLETGEILRLSVHGQA